MKASDLFVKALENEGVEYIFGIPGEENLDFVQSLSTSKIRLIVTRHEQGAGFMAANYGRLTGKPGVVLSTLGPGAANLVNPAAYAQLGAMPLVMITGQKPIKEPKQGRFQIIDVVEMMKPLTKFTRQVTHGRLLPSITREAFRIAQEERPGAVHIELPEDIAQEKVKDSHVFKVVRNRIASANKQSLLQATDILTNAKQPLILIGAGANRKRACEALTSFIDEIGIPFCNTQMGKGIVDERHPLFVGTAALSDHDFVHEAIKSADVIINVGHDTIEKPPFFMKEQDTRQVIHLNFFPAEIDEVYFPQLNVIGDIAASIRELEDLLRPVAKSWDNKYFIEIKENVNQHLTKYMEDERFPILPQRLVKITRELLGASDITTLDNGIYKIWFARNYNTYKQNTLLLDNALATMGAGLPSALIAKELYPDRKVVSINGDGGFLMNSQELETAARMNLDLVIIILNDQALGMIKMKQEDMGFDEFGLDYTNPDFVKYIESFGGIGYRPDSVSAFKEDFEKALSQKGLHLIDLAVDYSLNHEILDILLRKLNH